MGTQASSRAAWGTSRGASLTHIWTGTHRDQTLCPVSNRAALCLLPRLRQFLGLGVQIEALMGMEVNKTNRQGGRPLIQEGQCGGSTAKVACVAALLGKEGLVQAFQ